MSLDIAARMVMVEVYADKQQEFVGAQQGPFGTYILVQGFSLPPITKDHYTIIPLLVHWNTTSHYFINSIRVFPDP